jgi:hypothetical protein
LRPALLPDEMSVQGTHRGTFHLGGILSYWTGELFSSDFDGSTDQPVFHSDGFRIDFPRA